MDRLVPATWPHSHCQPCVSGVLWALTSPADMGKGSDTCLSGVAEVLGGQEAGWGSKKEMH